MKDLVYIITSGVTSTTLEHSPDGWDETLLNIERSRNFYGIVRSYTVTLRFMLDGAQALRNYFYNKLTDTPVYLTIQKLDRIALTYYTVYRGIFDFTKFTDTENSVDVTITDRNLSNLIKVNFEIQYDINFLTSNEFRIPVGVSYTAHDFIYYSRLLSLVLDKVTDGGITAATYGIDTTVLETMEANTYRYALTNHSALKGYAMYHVKTSLKDVLQSMFVVCKVGASVDVVDGVETLVAKTLDTIFGTDVVELATGVTDFRISMADDFIFDKLQVGHPDQEYGVLPELLREFNCTSYFKINNLTNINNELNLVNPYRADWQGMKESRDNPTDYVSDEQIFVVAIRRELPDLYLQIEAGTVYNGVDAVSWYNARLSPKHLLIQHQSFIDSCRHGGAGDCDYIGSGHGNFSNSTTDATIPSVTLEEFSGFTHGIPGYFIPVYAEFATFVPADIITTITSNPFSRYQFYFKGVAYSGYIMNVGLKLHGKSSATFKLLLSPDTDLSTLIR